MPNKVLTESEIISLMKLEWNSRLKKIVELKDSVFISNDEGEKEKESIISPELRITHEKTGIEYTVDSVGPININLRGPPGKNGEEGKLISINRDKLSDFVLKPGAGKNKKDEKNKEKNQNNNSSSKEMNGDKNASKH